MGGSPSTPKPYVPPPEQRVDPEVEAAKARETAIERRRRGLSGLIATSLLGVLADGEGGRKRLLGD